MLENPLLYTRLSLQVVFYLKKLKYFKVTLNIFLVLADAEKCNLDWSMQRSFFQLPNHANKKYFCFLFIVSRTLLQSHAEYNRLL